MRTAGVAGLRFLICVFAVCCAPDDADRCGDDLRFIDGECFPLESDAGDGQDASQIAAEMDSAVWDGGDSYGRED